jgi:tetratricopeptide (TPR) repeat protein
LSTKIHCLKCYGGISDLYMRLNEYDNAVQQLQEALAYAHSSAVKHDHVVVLHLRQKLATAENTLALTPDRISQITQLERQADAEIENGTLDKATETLRELLGLRRAILKNMKDRGLETTDQIYSIACLLQTFGFVFAKNGDDLNAEIAFKDASLLFKKTGRASTDPTITSPTRLSL